MKKTLVTFSNPLLGGLREKIESHRDGWESNMTKKGYENFRTQKIRTFLGCIGLDTVSYRKKS